MVSCVVIQKLLKRFYPNDLLMQYKSITEFFVKRYWIEQFVLSILWANSSGTVNPMADSSVVLSAKVNCRPWVTVLRNIVTV